MYLPVTCLCVCIVDGTPLQVRVDQTRIEVEEGQSARFVCSVISGSSDVSTVAVLVRRLERMTLLLYVFSSYTGV